MIVDRRLITLLAFGLVLLLAPAMAGAAGLDVRVVKGSNAEVGDDDRLATLLPQLRALFRYSSFRLLKQQTLSNQGGSVSMPGGRSVAVSRMDGKARVVIRKGDRVLLDGTYRLDPGEPLLLGGPRFREGVLIIAISAIPSSVKTG